MTEHARLRGEAMAALARYELQVCADQPFDQLSGGQQARLQILLLELAGATLLLLDEPTDNLDLASAEALQQGLGGLPGDDRWPSPTTAGSPAPSTGSWCSARTGTCRPPTPRSGTKARVIRAGKAARA